jgi:hypothetical protein
VVGDAKLGIAGGHRAGVAGVFLMALLLAGGMLSGCSSIEADEIGAGVEITGEIPFSGAMGVSPLDLQNPVAGNGISWTPVYTITNRTRYQLHLRDIDLDFPYRTFAHEGRDIKVDLVEVQPGPDIERFRSLDELERNEPSETLQPPLSIEPGEQVSVRLHEALAFTFDDRPVVPANNEEALQLLGPFLDMQPNETGYQCAVGHRMEAVVDFVEGELRRVVEQTILPAGCTLRIPE